ncbi:hypothetical protein F4677DRAFT_451269 [Hypoxylon crocopeplum]|nr:hypothetical protein F4677DRAFT_451269 [Hypoxylon crocopeplum]
MGIDLSRIFTNGNRSPPSSDIYALENNAPHRGIGETLGGHTSPSAHRGEQSRHHTRRSVSVIAESQRDHTPAPSTAGDEALAALKHQQVVQDSATDRTFDDPLMAWNSNSFGLAHDLEMDFPIYPSPPPSPKPLPQPSPPQQQTPNPLRHLPLTMSGQASSSATWRRRTLMHFQPAARPLASKGELIWDPTIFQPLDPDSFRPKALRSVRMVMRHGMLTAPRVQLVLASTYPWWLRAWAEGTWPVDPEPEPEPEERHNPYYANYWYEPNFDYDVPSAEKRYDPKTHPDVAGLGGSSSVFARHPTDPWWPLTVT